jgi:ubiquinone/menaquinone biosynthesis C-methylase UbiE
MGRIGNAERILDAGCGEGITLEKLIKHYPGRSIRGIDIDEYNVEVCRQYNLPVERGDVMRMNFPDESFDCCLFLEVVEHLEQPQFALAEIRRVLCSGGRLILIFPNDFMFKVARLLCFKFKEAFAESGHVKQWTPKSMRIFLQNNGFSVISTEYLPAGYWPFCLHCLVTAEKEK